MDFSAIKTNRPVCGSKQCVVSSYTDVFAGQEFCPALSDNDATCCYSLAAEQFYASVLRIAVPPVFSRTLSFFMCHEIPLLSWDKSVKGPFYPFRMMLSSKFIVNFMSKSWTIIGAGKVTVPLAAEYLIIPPVL